MGDSALILCSYQLYSGVCSSGVRCDRTKMGYIFGCFSLSIDTFFLCNCCYISNYSCSSNEPDEDDYILGIISVLETLPDVTILDGFNSKFTFNFLSGLCISRITHEVF